MRGGARHGAGERQDRLEVVVVEAELPAEEVVALRGGEDVVDAAEQPEALDELVRDEDAVARLHLFAEPEEIVHDLEPVLQEVQIEADAARRLLDAEAT